MKLFFEINDYELKIFWYCIEMLHLEIHDFLMFENYK